MPKTQEACDILNETNVSTETKCALSWLMGAYAVLEAIANKETPEELLKKLHQNPFDAPTDHPAEARRLMLESFGWVKITP